MRSALKELYLSHLFVVYPGDEIYPLEKNITAVGLNKIEEGFRLFSGNK